jgi:small-conductance mechanosensitive channel
MDLLKVTQWLESRFGLPPWFIVAVIQPLEIFLLAFFLREFLLWLVLRREEKEERRRLWRRVSLYVTIALGITGVALLWRMFSLEWLYQGLSSDLDISDLRIILLNSLYALVSTASFIFFLFVLRRLKRSLIAKLDEWTSREAPIRYQKAVLISRSKAGRIVSIFLRYLYLALILVSFYFYVPLMLSFFPATAPYANQLMPYITNPAKQMVIAFWGYIPRMLSLIVIIIIVRFFLKMLRTVMRGIQNEEITLPGFDAEWGHPTYQLGRILVILLTAVLIYPLLPGAGSEVFKGFSVFVGAVITLGSSSAINNIISGIVLTYTRAFRVGDRVRIGEVLGDIEEKGLFVTRVHTWGNEIVTIPNGKVLSGDVVNLSTAATNSGLAIRVEAGIGYDVDWRKVHELMKEAARNTPGIEKQPEPYVIQKQLGDYAVSYQLVGSTMEPKKERFIASDLRANVLDAFNREGIEIMTPSVSAIRDANEPAIPDKWDPKPFRIPGIRLFNLKGNS